MKTITKEYVVYKFNELNQTAQDKAINDYINAYFDCMPWEHLSSKAKKACKKAEKMQAPWFTGSYYWEYGKTEILNKLKEFQFLKSGSTLLIENGGTIK